MTAINSCHATKGGATEVEVHGPSTTATSCPTKTVADKVLTKDMTKNAYPSPTNPTFTADWGDPNDFIDHCLLLNDDKAAFYLKKHSDNTILPATFTFTYKSTSTN
jgi:hypothetical protein